MPRIPMSAAAREPPASEPRESGVYPRALPRFVDGIPEDVWEAMHRGEVELHWRSGMPPGRHEVVRKGGA